MSRKLYDKLVDTPNIRDLPDGDGIQAADRQSGNKLS